MTGEQRAWLDSWRRELDAERDHPAGLDTGKRRLTEFARAEVCAQRPLPGVPRKAEVAKIAGARARLGLALAIAVKAERAGAAQVPAVDPTKIEYSAWVEKWMLEHAHESRWREDFQRHHQNQWRLWEYMGRPLADGEIVDYLTLVRAARKRLDEAAPHEQQSASVTRFRNDPLFQSNVIPFSAVLDPMERVILSGSWDTEGVSTGIPPEGTFDESP